MSRFGTTQYNAGSSGSSTNNDYKERDPFLLDKYAIVTFDLDSVGVYDGDFGQSMILNMDDIDVVEGVVSSRMDDGKQKVFGWDRWFDRDENMELKPLPGQDTVSADDLPSVESQDAGGDTYRYQIGESVFEGVDEPVDFGDGTLWLNNGKKARTLAKVLSERGHDIIDDENEQEDYGWLDANDRDSFELRDELEGRRLMMWFEQVTIPAEDRNDDEDEDIVFTDTVLLDADTEAGITIKNDEGDDGGDDSGGTIDSDTADTEESDGGSGGDFPGEVADLVDMFARTGQTNRESIESTVEEAAPDGYEVDMDAVMAAIEEQA